MGKHRHSRSAEGFVENTKENKNFKTKNPMRYNESKKKNKGRVMELNFTVDLVCVDYYTIFSPLIFTKA